MTIVPIEKPQHYYKGPRREMLAFVPPHVRHVLEIGCGEGSFGSELKRVRANGDTPVEVTGIEIMPERAKVAAGRLDRVLCANFEHDALEIALESFDCVVCNDVLEHLVSPWNALRRLSSFLRPGGVVVASIPNVRYWGVVKALVIDGDWRYEGEGVLDATHLRFFTRRSITRLFAECGFQLQRIEGINQQVRGWKFELLRLITLNRLDDVKYWQFAAVARWPGPDLIKTGLISSSIAPSGKPR